MKEALWKNLSGILTEKIRNGGFADGSFPTIKELCKEYSVSDITARRVISELSALGLIDKARGRGCSLIQKKGPEEIFLLLQEQGELESVHSYILSGEVYRGIIDETARHGIKLTPISLETLSNMPKENLHIVSIRDIEESIIEKLKPARIVIAHTMKKYKDAFVVESDLKVGAFKAVDYLIKKGHRRVAIVSVNGSPWFSSRLEGYIQAHSENELGVDFSLVKTAEKENYASNEKALAELMALPEPPTAVFAVTDIHALNIVRAASARGLRVPEDIAVIGFDNIPESSVSTPPLSTVETFWRKKGESAVQILISEKPENLSTGFQLVIRSTT